MRAATSSVLYCMPTTKGTGACTTKSVKCSHRLLYVDGALWKHCNPQAASPDTSVRLRLLSRACQESKRVKYVLTHLEQVQHVLCGGQDWQQQRLPGERPH